MFVGFPKGRWRNLTAQLVGTFIRCLTTILNAKIKIVLMAIVQFLMSIAERDIKLFFRIAKGYVLRGGSALLMISLAVSWTSVISTGASFVFSAVILSLGKDSANPNLPLSFLK